ncbi:MAG: Fur family transcriptional regulator [Candidatus Promineifilaceae bacterium]
MGDRAEVLLDALAAEGHRLTPARRAIVTALVACRGHITADDLALRLREAAPQVGRMTVYRTLELLCDLGLVRPIFLGTGAAHYVLMDGGSHHHLICIQCQRVIDFDRCQESALAETLGQQFNFEVQGHLLEVYGLCDVCRVTNSQVPGTSEPPGT